MENAVSAKLFNRLNTKQAPVPVGRGGGGRRDWHKQKGDDSFEPRRCCLHLLDFMPGTLDIPPPHSLTEPPPRWGRLALHHGKCSLSGKTGGKPLQLQLLLGTACEQRAARRPSECFQLRVAQKCLLQAMVPKCLINYKNWF